MIAIGVDPGRKGGTGIAAIDCGPHRSIICSDVGVWNAKDVVLRVRLWFEKYQTIGPVGIEIMTPMGAAKFNAGVLGNAQFVGEIIGRLEQLGENVYQVTKREALAAIACKGKAPESRVRRCVEALLGSTEGMKAHAVDAAAAAWAAKLRVPRLVAQGRTA